MTSPIDAFVTWYRAIPLHDQQHLAFLVASAEGTDVAVPDGTPPADNPTLAEGLIARLQRPYKRRLEVLARLGVVKTVMEVCLAIPKADNETWASQRAQLITFMVMEGSKGDTQTAGLFKHLLDRVPEEEDRWAEIWLAWKDLTEKTGALSDESLRKWFEEGFTGDLTFDD